MKKLLIILALLLIPALVLARGDYYKSVSGLQGEAGLDDVYDARIQLVNGHTCSHFKIILLSEAGVVLAVSNPGVPVNDSIVTVTFPSSYTLVTSTKYLVGVIADDGYLAVGSNNTWSTRYDTTNSYSSPANVTLASDDMHPCGVLSIILRNSLGTTLLGSLTNTNPISVDLRDRILYSEIGTY